MKFVFDTDEHHPYQDDRAIELAQRITNDFDPDILFVGSDGIDFYQLSHFNKNPLKQYRLQQEINSWKKTQLAWIDAAPNAVRKYIKGNHEDRLRKYLWANQEMFGLDALELPNLLDFMKLKIDFKSVTEDFYEYVIDNVAVIKHGEYARKFSGYSAKAEIEAERNSISTFTGHSHRGGSHLARTRRGVVQAYECFCLCLLEPEYAHHPDWQQGIMLGTITNGVISAEPVVFVEKLGRKTAIWRDKEYIV